MTLRQGRGAYTCRYSLRPLTSFDGDGRGIWRLANWLRAGSKKVLALGIVAVQPTADAAGEVRV